jgi:dUTP pyrophosphatase
MKLKVKLLRDGARLPVRAYPTDAGADVFYCHNPDEHNHCIGEDDEYWISAKASCVIPTGIKVEVPPGYMLEVKNKSGIASKRQLVVGACVIDSGYDGEVFVNLHNLGRKTQMVHPGEKLAQLVLVPVETCEFVAAGDNLNNYTLRGDGGFGSTGDR